MPASPHLPSLAVLPDHPSWPESLAFQLNGLIVVFAALGGLWLLLETSGAWFRHRAARSQPKPAGDASPSKPDAAPLVAKEEVHAPTLAVIAAAVHILLRGQPHRIRTISPAVGAPDWAREGRREIFSSHRVR